MEDVIQVVSLDCKDNQIRRRKVLRVGAGVGMNREGLFGRLYRQALRPDHLQRLRPQKK